MCTICKEILEDEKEGKAHILSLHPEAVIKERLNIKTTVPRGLTQDDKISKVLKIATFIFIFFSLQNLRWVCVPII